MLLKLGLCLYKHRQRWRNAPNMMEFYMSDCNELLVNVENKVGLIHFNRPKALNALTLPMITAMKSALESWQNDPEIETVLVTGEGEKAFCAGGDVKAIYFEGLAGNLNKDGFITSDFFREEYKLNALIAAYKKPIVSIWDGIVMGGGVGVSIMGSHRIGSEKLKFGMPETAIGFFPDVGGAYFMSRMGPIGTLLSLTGQALVAGDAFALGVATDFVAREDMADFKVDLISMGLEEALKRHSGDKPAETSFAALKNIADAHFAKDTVEEIFASLEADEDTEAQAILTTLKKRSPAAMKVTLAQLQRGADLDFNACLNMEFRICQHALNEHDFYEGIRSVLVDKDHKPVWKPENLEKVSAAYVEKHFESLNDRELSLI